jgi:hypothetical protein
MIDREINVINTYYALGSLLPMNNNHTHANISHHHTQRRAEFPYYYINVRSTDFQYTILLARTSVITI